MNYGKSIELLTSQSKFHINLGLERVSNVLNLIGNPQTGLKIVHIAGTNGKGSVCSISANILKCAGYKTGLYTSPHLAEYTERIKINNTDITKDEFAKYISFVCDVADKNGINLTEFEILTVCAYKYFADNNTDIAFIETGLGGRFDATNAINMDLVSVITSISLDHTDRLGSTIEKIAFEKAGIIKENSSVIISKNNQGFKTVTRQAEKINAKVIEAADDIEINDGYACLNGKKYEFPLLGVYQRQNLALAVSTVNFLKHNGFVITESAFAAGLKTAKWAARLEYIKEKNMIIDGAHNPDAAFALRKSLDLYFKNQKRIYIYSTINTKDYKKIAEILFNKDDEIYYYEFNHKNAVSYEEYIKKVDWLKNLKRYNSEVQAKCGLKILTGSLYMIGEFLQICCT